MAYRVNIEPEVWGDPNYEVVARVMGWTFPEFAVGFVAKLWAKSQHEGVTEATAEQLNEFIGLKLDEALWVKALLRGKIIEKVGPDRYKIRGNKDQIQGIVEYKKKKSEAGKKSAESRKAKFGSPVPVGGSNFPDNTEQNPSTNRTPVKQCSESVPEQNPNTAEPITNTITNTSTITNTNSQTKLFAGAIESDDTTPKEITKPDGPSPTAVTWRAYKAAYEKRWGNAPPWNAKMAGQFRSFVSRVPREDAPSVAQFYLTHNDRYYVKSMHPVGLLLRDAEKLYTEWKTNRKVTDNEARSAESGDHYREQMKRLGVTNE